MTAVSVAERAWELILEEAREFKEYPNTKTFLDLFKEGDYEEMLFRIEHRVATEKGAPWEQFFDDDKVLDIRWRLTHSLEDLIPFVRVAISS